MSALRRVGSIIATFFYRDTAMVRGQFTGANGSVGTILFKGIATVTRTGEGTYQFKLLADDGVAARKNYHLKNFVLTIINPNVADGGSGPYFITTDAISSAGTIDFQTNNAAGAAADIIAVCKMAVELSLEAAS